MHVTIMLLALFVFALPSQTCKFASLVCWEFDASLNKFFLEDFNFFFKNHESTLFIRADF